MLLTCICARMTLNPDPVWYGRYRLSQAVRINIYSLRPKIFASFDFLTSRLTIHLIQKKL
jgi:hypothetical protein